MAVVAPLAATLSVSVRFAVEIAPLVLTEAASLDGTLALDNRPETRGQGPPARRVALSSAHAKELFWPSKDETCLQHVPLVSNLRPID